MDIGKALNLIDQRLKALERSPRLSHASIENTAIQVNDSSGGLRAIIGVQSDGTTAANIVNGPPPPVPSAPIVASVLGGVTASWDGQFADGSVLPLDWSRVEVHASTSSTYTPTAATLQDTIETAQGATVVVPCDAPVYVLLVARNTSGAASSPSAIVGPFGPAAVVANDVLDGIVTTVKLADDAVTQAKIAVAAVGSTEIGAGAVLSEKLADAAVQVGKIADNAVTGPAIAANAVTAGKVAADAITAREIAAGSVTAAEIAAGAITADKLTITGGANLLSDPSFEGAYSAAIVTGDSFFSIDAIGNGSSKSLKVNAVAGAVTTRSKKFTTVPILPGDQLFLACDYLTSSDYTSTAIVKMYARWEDSAGATLGWGTAQATPPVLGGSTWPRITNTVTAPPTTVQATIWFESYQAQAGSLWFDNAVVRPVAASTQIQDGAITTPKVAALAIQAGNIAADAVAAGKIAADAVTAREIAALSVTAAEIAANAITAGKIQAGAVDATALAADAITGKTITGGTITGAVLQTATTGERITLNEGGTNEVLLYNSSGAAIGELSARGLLVKGTTGAVIWLNPQATYPQVTLYNAANTNKVIMQVVEPTTGEANLEMLSGAYTLGTYTDMRSRVYLAKSAAVIERLRADDPSHKRIGGRLFIGDTYGNIGFVNDDNTAQETGFTVEANLASVQNGRLYVLPPASVNSALYVEADAAHTGNLARLYRNGVDQFKVDTNGNTNAAGILTAGNIASGRVTITPVPNTPTSAIVSGLTLKGGTVRVVATPVTGFPGTEVLGVGVSGPSTTGFTIWLTRSNNATTSVDWIAYAT